VKNLDSADCTAVSFTIKAPSVTGLALTLSAASLNLTPGQSGSINIDAAVAANITTSTALNFTANTSSTSSVLHSVSVKGTANVTVTTNVQDTTAPTKAAVVSVIKRGPRSKVSWTASTDESQNVIYKVIVDGKEIAETLNLSIRLRLPDGAAAIVIRAMDPSGNYSDSAAYDLSQIPKLSYDSKHTH
jgi:hypothetical protein